MNSNTWSDEVPFAITVCDTKGIILEMNQKSASTFSKDGGRDLVNKSLMDCHPEKAQAQIRSLIENEQTNIYTIEKNGIKKLIYQCPWYSEGKMAGLVELSLVIPNEIPRFKRG